MLLSPCNTKEDQSKYQHRIYETIKEYTALWCSNNTYRKQNDREEEKTMFYRMGMAQFICYCVCRIMVGKNPL